MGARGCACARALPMTGVAGVRWLGVAGALAAAASLASAHPDANDPGLIAHWAVDEGLVGDGVVMDATHALSAKVVGSPRIETVGPAQAAVLGGADYLVVTPAIGEAGSATRAGLPTRAFTAAAWVNLSETIEWGSITGALQDDGDKENGWLLGFDRERFMVGLSTVGADDGNGRMTYLKGTTPISHGRWYHVAATYDGETTRLYVNGKQEAETKEQSGDILYAAQSPYTVGCYQDSNERYPMTGAVHRVKVYDRALPAAEIAAVVAKNMNLVTWQPPASDLAFLVTPYLQYATLDSMTVMAEATRPVTMKVEYAEHQPFELAAEDTTPGAIAEVEIRGLKPMTTYFYRVTCTDESGRTLQSPIRSFQTAVPADMPYAFALIGDTQRNPAVTKRIADAAYGLRPNFLVHLGDVVDDGFAKNQWLGDLFGPCATLLSYVPMYPVIGNHENDSHFYYDYFHMPAPEYWYTFTQGNAEFFMIDTNRPTNPGSEQYRWLEERLAASKATWKFAAHHHPCFSSDNDDHGDTEKGAGRPTTWGVDSAQHLIALYEKYGVDIVFNGHIHVYERTWPIFEMAVNMKKGVRYITSGGAGGGLEKAAPNRAWFSMHFNPSHHFCYATVFQNTMQFKAYDLEGRLFDTFELTKD